LAVALCHGVRPPEALIPLRILYHHRVASRDGQAVHIDELIHAFRELGHDIIVVAPPGFERSSLGHEPRLFAWIKRRLPTALYELIELSYNVPAYLRLRRALRRTKPDLIYERHGLFLVAGTLLGRRSGIPVFLEVNSPLAYERAAFGGLGLKRLASRMEIWAWRHATHVLPVSQVLANIVGAAGVPADRISLVPNGINPDFLRGYCAETTKTALGLAGKTVLGFTGFMRTWHGLDAVLEILAQPGTPSSLHLLLIGDGPARPALEQQAALLNVRHRVTFAGLIERLDVAKLVAAFDIAIQPKVVEYASPLKLFEYMAAGKAIVAPDQANIREILAPDADAILFDPARPDDMARAILRLAADPALRERLGTAARLTIDARRLTWRANAERITALAQRGPQAQREASPAPDAAQAFTVRGAPTGPDRRS
jgi:glycosyltransferase involved in cell wall biosynthesis